MRAFYWPKVRIRNMIAEAVAKHATMAIEGMNSVMRNEIIFSPCGELSGVSWNIGEQYHWDGTALLGGDEEPPV